MKCVTQLRILFMLIFLYSISVTPAHSGLLSALFGSRKKKKEDDLQPVSDDKAKQYLQQFGYVGPSQILGSGRNSLSADLSDIKDTFKSAVRKFQEFAGLSPSGELDLKTKKKMAEPRCGVFDVQAITSGREAAFKWKKNQLTYSILSFSPDLPQRDIKEAIRKAFDLWSEASPLEFTEVSPSDSSADIKVRFAPSDHGDPWPFDGRGGVLAHATMPSSGMLHFDEDENWVYMDAEKIAGSSRYTDLLPVAIHESGHTLGLQHARTDDSIMAPFYQETVDDNGNYIMPKLRPADVRAIQEIYGARRGGSAGRSPSHGRSDSVDSGFGSSSRGGSERGGRDRSGSGRGDDDDFLSRGRSSSFTTTTTQRPNGGGLFNRFLNKFLGDKSPSSSSSSSGSSDNDFGSSSSGAGSSGRRGGTSTTSVTDGSVSGGRSGSFGEDSSFSRGGGSSSFAGDCPHSIDAFTPGLRSLGGVSYFFQGSKVYEVRGRSIQKTHSLRLFFPNGPLYVEAAYVSERSQALVLFQSYQVYTFSYNSAQYKFILNQGYPKRLSGFNPVGAMQWIDGHQFLFSRDGQFSVYDEYWNQVTSTSRLEDYFPGFPTGVKGGFADDSGSVTLFTTTRVYRYNASAKRLLADQQSIASYLGC